MNAQRDSDAVFIHIHERLDPAKADRVKAWLRENAPGHEVVLDFHETRSFDLAALTNLARWLLETSRPIALRGLSAHHYRLFRYIGLQYTGLPRHLEPDDRGQAQAG